jgi:hypothetical protein
MQDSGGVENREGGNLKNLVERTRAEAALVRDDSSEVRQ